MVDQTRWELRPEQLANPGRLEEFKTFYNDHSIKVSEMQKHFSIVGPGVVHAVAVRLGCASRERIRTGALAKKGRIQIDHDAQIAELETKLAEARLAKAKAQLHFTWEDDHTLVIHGIGPDFRRLEGLPRLGEFLAKTKGW